MGQPNSTQASSSRPVTTQAPPSMPPSSSPSSTSIPSTEDLRNLASRILASMNECLKNMRENNPAIELPSVSSPSSSDASVVAEAVQNAGASATSMASGSSFAEESSSVNLMIANNENKAIKLHWFDWAKNNKKTIAIGVLALGVAVIVGTVAVNTVNAYLQKMRRLRVLKAKDGAKREVVVIINVATLEGAALAISLEYEGFIVFVGVPNQVRAEEVKNWGHTDIHAIVIDSNKTNAVEDLVRAVSNFLDQRNSVLLGGSRGFPLSSMILQEELSSSTTNIRLVGPEQTSRSVGEIEAMTRHHGKTNSPLFRLAAVVVNPHSSALGTIEKVDLELWRQSIDTNVIGTAIVVQKFLPLLRRTLSLAKPRRSPRLIFVSSAITGSVGFPFQSAICASHRAIESIADSVRREIKPQGIDVICLRPGVTDRSFRKEWGGDSAKANAGSLGLLSAMDPTRLLKELFKPASTTSAFCDAAFEAITSKWPSSSVKIGNGSLSYAFVGWAIPRYLVDWSIKRRPVKVFSSANAIAAAKVSSTFVPREE
ncbi:hypothetical protein EDD21DRAFT_225695 [Dissophora ornata]|nr:hypothetical protein BGZ58_008874 [Dissophora ornata]KAI8604317.1 hypothetical protein EDD21DRAFT_225695 [Dissophora ornata]